MTSWTVQPEPVDSPLAVAVIRTYLADIIERYYGRPATSDEVDQAIADDPTDDLAVFLVARRDGVVRGCVGFRMVGPESAELKRMFVDPTVRGTGGGATLLSAAERAAVSFGATVIRLDTRSDLVEARALYARHGYREVAPFNDDRYAEHGFEKRL
ncbi:GNAT superfamily N-acetyltransferase [Saccharothrix ecbatanensis]|uniref:GNAT superfamily N-acetyltransferase n=1 Tax=Saccharothrix ecbatanensis TaxID=1105145 RepID=A0A7W9HER5_9PSEU|nr:GNAT family N-acetyltransferase [Saccharothrix ecbatanensis]MBB5800619.1 GNAT superfamily N-acetyltransferase [Saccharothrix ecbatanensis]